MGPSKKLSPASEREAEHIEQCTTAKDHLDSVHQTLARFWLRLAEAPDEHWRLLFEVAAAEIAANIVEHASPPIMTFRVRTSGGRVVAEFHDSGQGWSGRTAPEHSLYDLAERGRGLALARVAVDEVAYERLGSINRWRLVKRL